MDSWEISKVVTKFALEKLDESIQDSLGFSQIINLFHCTAEEAKKIQNEWSRSTTSFSHLFSCSRCHYKNKACFDCVIVCQSPLERQMLIAFLDYGLTPVLQKRINKNGECFDYPGEIDKAKILTIPDFYIETKDKKICIYADGQTYHYTDESQGIRDRNIDRELQKLGFVVLRYTGQEIRHNCNSIIDKIKEYLQ